MSLLDDGIHRAPFRLDQLRIGLDMHAFGKVPDLQLRRKPLSLADRQLSFLKRPRPEPPLGHGNRVRPHRQRQHFENARIISDDR